MWKLRHVRRREVDRPYARSAAGRMDGSAPTLPEVRFRLARTHAQDRLAGTPFGWAFSIAEVASCYKWEVESGRCGFDFHSLSLALGRTGCRLVYVGEA